MKCKRSCGRKAKPGSLSRLCQVCEQRQLSRDYDQGRYRPPETLSPQRHERADEARD